jgi:hypothetical protein
LTPHEAQAWLAQLLQVGALWAIDRPSEWAKNNEITREVCSPWQLVQVMGESASLMRRKASKRVRQSWQKYS